jgi:outer membrane usher protein
MEGAGAIIHMPIRHTRSATVSLVDDLGQPIPAGSVATLPDGSTAPVGWDGILFLSDLPNTLTLDVHRFGGTTCRAVVTPPASMRSLANLGAVPCT